MASGRPAALHFLSLAIALGIAVVLLRPVPVVLETATQGSSFPYDKLVHFALFAVAALPWRSSFVALAGAGRRSPDLWVVGVAAVYGGLLEVAQGVWTARDPEWLDMVAGALGAVGALSALAARQSMAALTARKALRASGRSRHQT